MSKSLDIELKTKELLKNVINENELELVDVEYVKEKDNYYLKIIIDKVGGIFVNDCEVVSRAIDPELDRLNFIKDEYILEVSSPGLDRKLRADYEFTKYAGRLVEVKLYKKLEDLKEFQAELLGLEENEICLKLSNGDIKKISREDVAVIKLAFVEK